MPREKIVKSVKARKLQEIVDSIHYIHNVGVDIVISTADINKDGLITIDHSIPSRMVHIKNEAYQELMSDKPKWNKKKQKGKFEEDDLWHVITEIETGSLKII